MVFSSGDNNIDGYVSLNEVLIINFDEYDSEIQYNNCSGINFFNDTCTPISKPNSKNIIVSDFVYDIIDDIEKGEFNNIFNMTITEDKSTSKSENNVTYQISTVSSQYSTHYSIVELEDCESKLKKVYSLDKNEKLILLKVEYKIENIKIPIIEYQFFTKNGIRLDLNYCDISFEIVIPVNIEKEEFIYNPNSDFYNDKCFSYVCMIEKIIIIKNIMHYVKKIVSLKNIIIRLKQSNVNAKLKHNFQNYQMI